MKIGVGKEEKERNERSRGRESGGRKEGEGANLRIWCVRSSRLTQVQDKHYKSMLDVI